MDDQPNYHDLLGQEDDLHVEIHHDFGYHYSHLMELGLQKHYQKLSFHPYFNLMVVEKLVDCLILRVERRHHSFSQRVPLDFLIQYLLLDFLLKGVS